MKVLECAQEQSRPRSCYSLIAILEFFMSMLGSMGSLHMFSYVHEYSNNPLICCPTNSPFIDKQWFDIRGCPTALGR